MKRMALFNAISQGETRKNKPHNEKFPTSNRDVRSKERANMTEDENEGRIKTDGRARAIEKTTKKMQQDRRLWGND